MAASSGKKTFFERRLKELEKESKLVRSDIHSLSRVLEKPEDADVPKLKSRSEPPRIPPPSRPDPVTRPAERPPAEPGDLFTAARAPGPRLRRPGTPPIPAEPLPVARPKPAAADDRFVNYFATGSFVGGGAPPEARRVQRNKAIFMLLLVVLFAIILYSLLS